MPSGFKRVVTVVVIGGVSYLELRPEFDHHLAARQNPATAPPDHHHVPEEAPAELELFRPTGTISGSTAHVTAS